jgi:hypothetical protein
MKRPHYLMRYLRDHSLRSEEYGESLPLLYRAWTFQERLVSPRVIYFTEDEMVFECFSGACCECKAVQKMAKDNYWPSGKSTVFSVLHGEFSALSMTRSGLVAEPKAQQKWIIEETWRGYIVESFLRLNLSVREDRLPALAGIAEQFQAVRLEESYLAGLWSGSLIKDLLWLCSDSGSSNTRQRQVQSSLARIDCVPTWSWASLGRPIDHTSGWRISESGVGHKAICVAEVIKAKCEYLKSNSFGVLVSSSLILRSRILPCLLSWEYKTQGRDDELNPAITDAVGHLLYRDTEEPLSPFSLSPYLDRDDKGYQCAPMLQRVYLLELLNTVNGALGSEIKFLILHKQEDDEKIYTRAGLAWARRRSSYEECDWDELIKVFDQQSYWIDCDIR